MVIRYFGLQGEPAYSDCLALFLAKPEIPKIDEARASSTLTTLRGLAELIFIPRLGATNEVNMESEFMILNFMKAKIHQATVTQADLNYQGSIAIDTEILQKAGILPNEQVHVYNVTNGQRLITYAIDAPGGSRVVCVNGAAARLAAPGDRVIIVAYCQLTEDEARTFKPRVLILGDQNKPLGMA